METSPLSTIYNMVHVAEGLGTAGQPTTAQLAAIKDAGDEVIINLATGTTPRDLPNEAAVVATLGMEYIHIPVVWEHPTEADFEPASSRRWTPRRTKNGSSTVSPICACSPLSCSTVCCGKGSRSTRPGRQWPAFGNPILSGTSSSRRPWFEDSTSSARRDNERKGFSTCGTHARGCMAPRAPVSPVEAACILLVRHTQRGQAVVHAASQDDFS